MTGWVSVDHWQAPGSCLLRAQRWLDTLWAMAYYGMWKHALSSHTLFLNKFGGVGKRKETLSKERSPSMVKALAGAQN